MREKERGVGLLGRCWRGVERVALYSLLRRCFTVALFSFGGHRFISFLGNGVAFWSFVRYGSFFFGNFMVVCLSEALLSK